MKAKTKKPKEKKGSKKLPKQSYFKKVKKELKLVKWPTIKEVIKYTIATIIFCVVISVFFQLLVLLMSYIKEIFA